MHTQSLFVGSDVSKATSNRCPFSHVEIGSTAAAKNLGNTDRSPVTVTPETFPVGFCMVYLAVRAFVIEADRDEPGSLVAGGL